MKRRDFLHKTAHATAISGVMGSLPLGFQKNKGLSALINSAVETDHVLVLIYLNGGNDGLNTVVPIDQMSLLHQLRPHVVLDENSLLSLDSVDDIALHPSLPYYRDLFNDGKLKIIQNVGYQDQNFSHFRSTDIWMSASDSDELINSGWTGRYLDFEYPGYPSDYPTPEVPYPLAIEQGYGNSLLFQGPANNMGIVVRDPEEFYNLINNTDEKAPPTIAGDKLEHIRLIQRQSQVYGEVVQEAAEKVQNQGPYPSTSLADQLKIVSRLIAGGLGTRVYLVSLGGFDTHDNQVNSSDHHQGEHADLLTILNDATEAFMNDLDNLGVADRVMGLTFSEFGRRVVSNASSGTDHGSAAPMLVFGNKLEGGVWGQNPQLDSQMTYRDNLPHEFDFRQVYASVLNQWLCVEKPDIDNILGRSYDLLPISRQSDCFISTNTRKLTQSAGKNLIQVHPNPLNGHAVISYQSEGEKLQIQFLDGSGRLIEQVYSGHSPKGQHQLEYATASLPSGHYVCRIITQKYVQARALVKK